MEKLIEKIKLLSLNNNDQEIYQLIEEQLNYESNDIELWLSLAIVILAPPNCDHKKSIACLQKALTIDKTNARALLILAYVYEHELGGVDDELLHKIESFHTNSSEVNSMLKYAASWSYAKRKKNDSLAKERLLIESINLCNYHVWNYIHLARLYLEQTRNDEAQGLIKKAIHNVQKIYSDNNYEYDPTDVNEFLNEHIKGIHLTDENYKFHIKDKICSLYKN